MLDCPLCHHSESKFYWEDKRRQYHQCQRCELVFVDPNQRLDSSQEKAHYDLHENDPTDVGYRKFLSRVQIPLAERIGSHKQGLDFGCGPGPTLSLMMQEAGHDVDLYDLYYYPDTKVLNKRYDFITATEVIEHLYQPDVVWAQWMSMLKPGGWLGLMTKMVRDVEAFSTWHYKNDHTHVVFFSRSTFEFLAARDELELEFIENDVILLRKSSNEST
ncbi:methyltransferase domain-containing protein [Vibrio breoganii]|uniref:2-polyprenyl-3-methyl-5-hydroxy-6-metoxy-1, 4-benzoquinol methylase n=2 Tax=Vibrio TaxID=662 RepID=A0AAP8MXG6_9VIBR|nr:methyltransferase domain-containing protein [Vibrio breoganii]MDN3714519.1 methyltransferase domain-containing protein [Vibrio breoganii]OCH73420.1 2-polyprenyl-3-methyl-5-hydroxy-6-metoxy-1,4-benzoquinol methylase [Vibrio breoganii]PMF80600.1 2-polyprenyl-3-methyl-5-hydroxy-6-metoxy-1,4-benzoquinol methylase [Vibrio breoganii]PMG05395.1 2-polyprenyl-3-methyl-5-hydroxy-6-metoxy-1,4-benzoquinol methylase [Vibrio breoganii]PMG05766.1 2-polyprenyl-3-methyl-5-hydroxy-6-metoxy-1,4-benzoquinol me